MEGNAGRLRAGFEAAARASTPVERTLAIAGRPARLRVVGQLGGQWLNRTFGHLTRNAVTDLPLLQIDVFEAGREGSAEAMVAAEVTVSHDQRFVRQRLAGLEYMLDRRASSVVGAIRCFEAIPRWEYAKPFAMLLSTWLADEGITVIHAGLVSRDGEGILFAGKSGAGKSTCAFSCAAVGFEFLGDDSVALEGKARGGWTGHSLYSTVALEMSHLACALPACFRPAEGRALGAREKAVLAIGTRGDFRTDLQAEIIAIVLPRLTGVRRSALRRATPGEVLRTIGPSSILKRATPAGPTLAQLAQLTRDVPGYWLEMSRNPADIGDAVANLFAGVPV
jgi:hypothetical protein